MYIMEATNVNNTETNIAETNGYGHLLSNSTTTQVFTRLRTDESD
jgi:hypothetical protein